MRNMNKWTIYWWRDYLSNRIMIWRKSMKVLLMVWFVYVWLTNRLYSRIYRTSQSSRIYSRIYRSRLILIRWKWMNVMKYVWKINTKGCWRSISWRLMKISSWLRPSKIMKTILKKYSIRVKHSRLWFSRRRNWMNRISKWKIESDSWRQTFSIWKCWGIKRLKS